MGFVVEDTPFNRHYYSDMIGKWFDKPPAFAHVREISDTLRTIYASLEDGTDYVQIDGTLDWKPPAFGDIVTREMGIAASHLKTARISTA
jgi:hypothetical protein